MKKLWWRLLLGLALVSVVGCTLSLHVPLLPQQTSNWCWAASGQMAMQFLASSRAPSQCQEANDRFGLTTCCNTPTPSECVNGGWPEFGRYGFSAQTTSDTALSMAQLRSEFLSNRPVAFSWHWTGGGGHMMVAMGTQDADPSAGTPDMVEINDPWPPGSGDHYFLTYDAFVSGNDHTHWNDYYNIQVAH